MITNLLLLLFLFSVSNSLFFQIASDKERCFIDDFLPNSIMVVKYKIYIESRTDKGKIFKN